MREKTLKRLEKARKLRESGDNYKTIAEKIGCSTSYVGHLLRNLSDPIEKPKYEKVKVPEMPVLPLARLSMTYGGIVFHGTPKELAEMARELM